MKPQSTVDVSVTVVETKEPAVAMIPVATPIPPPFPSVVPTSICSVTLVRLAFVQAEKTAEAESRAWTKACNPAPP